MTAPIPYKGNYFAGRWVRPKRGTELISEDPGDLFHPVGRAIISLDPLAAAVDAAEKAFVPWAALPMEKRIAKIRLFQKELKRRSAVLTPLIAREAGKPLAEAVREVERLIAKADEVLSEGLKLVRGYSVAPSKGLRGECIWRPLGVMAVIGPFNFPAHTSASHLIPALVMGNTVIFKPSEYTPFVGQLMTEAAHAAGFPKGVFNLMQGGSELGAALVAHPKITGVLFTGSTAAGQAIRESAVAAPQKILALEMGGKNAAWVLDNADLDLAAREIATAAYSMSGQRCNATSRVLVHRKVVKPFLEKFLACVDRVSIGYSLEPVVMGPLISHDAVAKYQNYMKLAREEGFETLRAGKAPGSWGNRRGYYVTPSVHWCEQPAKNKSARYRREEIFGPDVAVYAVRGDEEAMAINNEVPYGLITAVFTGSRERFRRLLPRIDTGMINWNKGTIFSSGLLPFGGTKASGSYRPAGLFSPYYCATPTAVLEDSRILKERNLPF